MLNTFSFVFSCPRLKQSPLKVRFCTNESQKSLRELVGLLQRLGFDISEEEVTAPAPATCKILKERGLRPHLLIHEGRPALGLTFEVKPGEKACMHACMRPLGQTMGNTCTASLTSSMTLVSFQNSRGFLLRGGGEVRPGPICPPLTSGLKAS